jgi:hypothetical protein
MPVPIGPPQSTNGKSGVKSPYRISPSLMPLATPVDNLVLDPLNTRLHPERNLEAIKASLIAYGQVKPIVVRKQNNVVVAGNGTLRAAKSLGWDQIAAVFVEMTDVEAAGYGLADNRTAELAKWDFEVISRIDKILSEHGHTAEGWTDDELSYLRGVEWVEPKKEDTVIEGNNAQDTESTTDEGILVSFTVEQYTPIYDAIELLKQRYEIDDLSESDAISFICGNWLEREDA